MQTKIDPSWNFYLDKEFQKPYMKNLEDFLEQREQAGAIIHPSTSLIFESLRRTSYQNVKVVIIGQDPYHGPNQAHGLSFSVPRNVAIPPSLRNILQELKNDLGCALPSHGCLDGWADQGVLLLNSVLTVEEGRPASHAGRGWEIFTDAVIHAVDHLPRVVFILWGSYAQKKISFVDEGKHLILRAPHPSPLSSYRGFFNSKPFSKTNKFLNTHKIKEIEWDNF